MMGQCTYFDRSGRRYEVDVCRDENLWTIHLEHNGYSVGHGFCTVYDSVLNLGDLHIKESVHPRQTPLARIFRMLFRLPPPAFHPRGCGLGSALLDFIVTEATRAGISRITGSIFPKDYSRNPHLLDWYCKRGFSVILLPEGSGKVAEISRELGSPADNQPLSDSCTSEAL